MSYSKSKSGGWVRRGVNFCQFYADVLYGDEPTDVLLRMRGSVVGINACLRYLL